MMLLAIFICIVNLPALLESLAGGFVIFVYLPDPKSVLRSNLISDFTVGSLPNKFKSISVFMLLMFSMKLTTLRL